MNDTSPNWKIRLKEIADATDPVIDKLLLKVVASGWSAFFVGGYTLALLLIGLWVGYRP